jgi:hypothetical protein
VAVDRYMKTDDPALARLATVRESLADTVSAELASARNAWLIPIAWAVVWLPIGWGVWVTLKKAALLFH